MSNDTLPEEKVGRLPGCLIFCAIVGIVLSLSGLQGRSTYLVVGLFSLLGGAVVYAVFSRRVFEQQDSVPGDETAIAVSELATTRKLLQENVPIDTPHGSGLRLGGCFVPLGLLAVWTYLFYDVYRRLGPCPPCPDPQEGCWPCDNEFFACLVGMPMAHVWALVAGVWWLRAKGDIAPQRVDGLTADWLPMLLLITVVLPVTFILLRVAIAPVTWLTAVPLIFVLLAVTVLIIVVRLVL
jgi:hypothetical protein